MKKISLLILAGVATVSVLIFTALIDTGTESKETPRLREKEGNIEKIPREEGTKAAEFFIEMFGEDAERARATESTIGRPSPHVHAAGNIEPGWWESTKDTVGWALDNLPWTPDHWWTGEGGVADKVEMWGNIVAHPEQFVRDTIDEGVRGDDPPEDEPTIFREH